MIDLDITFFIQFANFVVTLIVVNFLLVSPIRDIIQKRKDTMGGLVEEAERFTSSADEKLANYKKALDEARHQGSEARASLKDEGSVEEKKILTEAGEQATHSLRAERDVVQGEVKSAMDGLKGQVDTLAGKVADKVLG